MLRRRLLGTRASLVDEASRNTLYDPLLRGDDAYEDDRDRVRPRRQQPRRGSCWSAGRHGHASSTRRRKHENGSKNVVHKSSTGCCSPRTHVPLISRSTSTDPWIERCVSVDGDSDILPSNPAAYEAVAWFTSFRDRSPSCHRAGRSRTPTTLQRSFICGVNLVTAREKNFGTKVS